MSDEWKNSCNSTLKWIADTSARVDAQDTAAPDLDHARAQRQEIEVGKINFFLPWPLLRGPAVFHAQQR